MHRERCKVLSNEKVAPGHFVIRFASSAIGKAARPGTFVQVVTSDSYEPLLPRPFSFLDTDDRSFSLLYHTVGKGTRLLSTLKKDNELWILGPLGKGFDLSKEPKTRVLVGGGVGIPPLYHLAKEWVKDKKHKIKADDIHVFLGARNKSLLLCEKEFKKLGVNLYLATDDGSKGTKGFVTQILDEFLCEQEDRAKVRVHTCGPTAMLKAVSALSGKYEVACEVSVEVPMACGFGVCLGCAIKVRSEESEKDCRFAIACTEGPVFDAKAVVWD